MSKKFYITATLPYVNAEPHIGFALEIIQADVVARYYRGNGFEVFFNTGADEHGAKIFRKAQEARMDTQEYCDIYAQKFDDLKEALNVTYNSFLRTTDSHHVKAAQEFWTRCQDKGDIYKKNYQIKYCVGCELEKTESELQDGKCPLHPSQPIELIEEENYFFKYSNYQNKLLKLYGKKKDFVVPKSRLREIEEFTKSGLTDFSISRLKEKMSWGVDVPGDPNHVMYVWFDALVSYISALGWPDNEKKFNDFWPGMQVAGKDNLRQQSSMWQAMLMSAGLPNSKQIFIHGFITVNGQKMSKSLGNVVDPFQLVQKYGADAVRYYLLREISPVEDGDFSYEKFEQRYNADLAGGIGNLVARTIALAQKIKVPTRNRLRRKPIVGGQKSKIKITNKSLKLQIKKTEKKYKETLEEFKFNETLKSIWEIISFCDKYINEEKPWEDKENSSKVISDILFSLYEIAYLLFPFLPATAEKITNAINAKESPQLFPRLLTN